MSDSNLQAVDASRNLNEMAMLYRTYQNRLFTSGSMDFDDLLFNTYVLFRDFPKGPSLFDEFRYG